MKIGIYDPYLDDGGGGEKYMMTIAECLSKNNDVDVFWDNKIDLENISKRFSIDLTKIKLVPNIFNQKISIQKLLKTRQYDTIIVLSDGSIPLVFSKKLLLHIQQPLKNFNSKSVRGNIKFSRVNAVFSNSEYTKSFNEKAFNIKSLVLYPPVDVYPKNLKKENIILTVGRFRVKDLLTNTTDYKKFSVMIDTFKDLVNEGLKDWKFLIATSVKPNEIEIFQDFKKSAKGYPIEFLVNKTNEELWQAYSKAKIYWHASGFGENLEEHPELAEHFGISTVEAMGAGVVPIVINAGGQKEIVFEGENGFLWNDTSELKNKTLSLINNKSQLNDLSKKAKGSVDRFNKDKFCQGINNLINK